MNTEHTVTSIPEQQVLDAADAIIGDFGAHRKAEYFGGFAPEASFMFYTADRRLDSRAEYEELWKQWEAEDGFRVHGCQSADRRVQFFGDVAIFTHSVTSQIEFGGVTEEVLEKESIIFELRDGKWVAIHEHLSPRS